LWILRWSVPPKGTGYIASTFSRAAITELPGHGPIPPDYRHDIYIATF